MRLASRQSTSLTGLLSLAVVYVVWSTTYLAIRIAVRPDSGFPPFTMAGLRIVVAGFIMLALGALFGAVQRAAGHETDSRFRVTPAEAAVLAVSGILLWLGGNGLVSWAEQRAASGYAALLVGSTPIWVATMEAAIDRKPPSISLVAALATGLAGVALLAAPVLASGAPADVAALIALIGAPMCWGAASLLLKRRPVHAGIAGYGYQSLIGGASLLLVALLAQEPTPDPTPEAWMAWAYLVVFGSVVAFTAYSQALRSLPITLVMTYTYVNPVGAVLLGRLLLGEPITPFTVAGAALVLLGVAGVFRQQLRPVPTVTSA